MKTPYELESLGWKITQIRTLCESQTCGDHTDHNIGEARCESKDSIIAPFNYIIFHPFHFPFGKEMKITTLKSVLEFIDNFIKEDQHKEEIERFNLDR